ncbi:hypothetical protein J1614_005665 [Plenodomus biglobosus]|nr:hypothetical protein J1614_005665 [Plenodomus biglobosus]
MVIPSRVTPCGTHRFHLPLKLALEITSMDPTTARLAVQLQLADIDDLLDDLYDSIEITDKNTRASFRVLQTDLRSQLEVLEGQILTLKILKDEHDERVAFKKLLTQERQAVSDHQLAMRLAGLATTDPEFKRSDDYDASLQEEAEDDSCSRWQQAKEAYETALDPHFMDQRSAKFVVDTSDTKISTKPTDDVTMCVACMEAVPVTATLTLACEPEAHTYCRACLEDLFSSSIVNTDLFPPRCCKIPIPIEICRAILPKDLVKDFDLKIEELAIPNPTYCSNANCSKFIRPNKITADIATCVYCHQKTCVRCKATQHNGLCPEDPHVQLLLDAAKRGKWQQCTNCKNMVELDYGCFHML